MGTSTAGGHTLYFQYSYYYLYLCLTLLAANACFAGFIRNTVLNLGEDFGQSAVRGIVLFFVILPLTALATVAAATVPLVVRDRP